MKQNRGLFNDIAPALWMAAAILLAGCVGRGAVDYGLAENWAYFGVGEGRAADLFLVCPTVDVKDEMNLSLSDAEGRAAFLGALNMERGIYEESARLYAPYYRQASLKAYALPEGRREAALSRAYEDVSGAFAWYLAHENHGRPIILAGFSQGADMCYRLIADFFDDAALSERLVAAYAIGWPLTAELCRRHPCLKPATGETDTGVVVSFECEAPQLQDSLIVPKGTKALAINPLNWRTDATPAPKEANLGACFTDYGAAVVREVPALCGAHLDSERGTLKVTDIAPEQYPPCLDILPAGSYHVYDYLFFFRNLQRNVARRLEAFLQKQEK